MNKVLVIAPYSYLPFFSGGQKFIAQFLDWLAKEIDVTVVTVKENDLSLAKGYRVIPLLRKGFSRYYDRKLIFHLASLINKESFDTIIWEHPYYGWLARIIKKRTGIKTILHTHNIEHQRFRSTGKWWWWVLKIYEKRTFKIADKIFFITPEDRQFAMNQWKIAEEKCVDVPFGIEISRYPDNRSSCRQLIIEKHKINGNEKLLLFNGMLSYKPNLDALLAIVNKINPVLLRSGLAYKIIICGKGLPAELNQLRAYTDKNIIYAGFVDDIESYFKAADLFLNPVQAGGGVKTKMIEAIGYGTTVISTKTGATGIHSEACGDKLIIVPDDEWKQFADAIINSQSVDSPTPAGYYHYYYWRNIVGRIKELF